MWTVYEVIGTLQFGWLPVLVCGSLMKPHRGWSLVADGCHTPAAYFAERTNAPMLDESTLQ
jgi:hypothetical protein